MNPNKYSNSKVVVVVDGGVVQSVYANHDINIVIIDHDNLRENFSRDAREMIEDTEVNDLAEQMDTEPESIAVVASQRLEYLRGELREECISQGELIELQALAQYIPSDDVELREAAGLPELNRLNESKKQ